MRSSPVHHNTPVWITHLAAVGLMVSASIACVGVRHLSAEESIAAEAIFSGDVTIGVAMDDLKKLATPMRERDPKKFWLNQVVFQKCGIVVEDRDYIIRKRYWFLDSYDVGRVTEVSEADDGIRCTVLFNSNERWQQKGFDKALDSVTTVNTTVMPAREGFRVESLVATYRSEGVAVDKTKCGIIVRHANEKAVYVEFPAALLCYDLPRVNDRVERGPDWSDGYADGWSEPIGPSDAKKYYGEVRAPRSLDGSIDVFWPVTGRTTSHRFDNFGGFFDVQKTTADRDEP